MHEFLAGLPGGIESHPEALVKASAVHAWIEGHSLVGLRAALSPFPAALAAMDASSERWVGEVPATLVCLGVRELFFSNDADFLRAAFAKNAALLDRPAYQPLFAQLGAERLVSWASGAFAQFHRGTTMSVVDLGPSIEITYDYPPGLVPSLIARRYVSSIAALLDKLSLPAVVEMESHGPTRAVFHAFLAASPRSRIRHDTRTR